MPIHPDLRPLYPPDWRALADRIKFGRAGGRCERCGRSHGVPVLVVGEGGWLDPETGERFDECGRSLGVCPRADWPAGRFVTRDCKFDCVNAHL